MYLHPQLRGYNFEFIDELFTCGAKVKIAMDYYNEDGKRMLAIILAEALPLKYGNYNTITSFYKDYFHRIFHDGAKKRKKSDASKYIKQVGDNEYGVMYDTRITYDVIDYVVSMSLDTLIESRGNKENVLKIGAFFSNLGNNGLIIYEDKIFKFAPTWPKKSLAIKPIEVLSVHDYPEDAPEETKQKALGTLLSKRQFKEIAERS